MIRKLFVICFLFSIIDLIDCLPQTQVCNTRNLVISLRTEPLEKCMMLHRIYCSSESVNLKCKISSNKPDCETKDSCPNPVSELEKIIELLQSQFNEIIENIEVVLDFQDQKILKTSADEKRSAFSTNFARLLYNTKKLKLKDLNLIELPTFNNLSTIDEISVTGNTISILKSKAFHDMPKLISILLSNNRIENLSNSTFDNLSELTDIDLSNNLLSIILNETFVNVPQLTQLTLANNQLHTIESSAFPYLERLEVLDLSKNLFDHVYSSKNLENLQYIYLNSNRIKKFSCQEAENFKNIFIIELDANKISDIDCDLKLIPNMFSLTLKDNRLTKLPESMLFDYLEADKGISIKGNDLDCSEIKWLIKLKSKFLATNKERFCKIKNRYYQFKDLNSVELASEVSAQTIHSLAFSSLFLALSVILYSLSDWLTINLV